MIDRRLLLAAAVAVLTACTAPRPAPPATAAQAAIAAAPHTLLLISIDGLRADMLDRGITPALSELARDGVRAQWMTP